MIDQTLDAGVIRRSLSSTLGGNVGLSGLRGQRYDLDLGLGGSPTCSPSASTSEMDVHTELGSVYRDLWRDAKWSNLQLLWHCAEAAE